MKAIIPLLIVLLVACTAKTKNQAQHSRSHQKTRDSYKISEFERRELERKKRLVPIQISNLQKMYDSTIVFVEAEKKESNHIDLFISVDMPDTVEIPEVIRGRMRFKIKANRLVILAKIYDSEEGYVGEVKGEKTFGTTYKRGEVVLQFTPEQLSMLKVGKHHLKLELSSYLGTIHGDKSSLEPMSMDVEFDLDVDPIYCSTIFFQELALNEKESRKILGSGNDHSNSTPEACIKIRNNSQTLIYDYNRNTYNLKRNLNKVFYHNSLQDELQIMAMDADYFLNSDDLISSATVKIDSLLGKTYKNIPLEATDKLLLYCTTEGQVN